MGVAVPDRPLGSVVRPWSSLLNITSLRGPITQIDVRSPGQVITAYLCPGSRSDDCLVELNGPALQDLLSTAAVTVFPGVYDTVSVIYCGIGETGYHSYLTGDVSIGGTQYFTRATGNLGTTGPAEPVALDYAGCVQAYAISPPLVVTDTVSIPILLRLYFDIRDLGYASLGDPATNVLYGHSGCTPVVTLGVTPFVCAAYPSVSAVEGTVPPVVERYRVNGGATIGLMFEAGTDRFVGGYFRRYAVEDQAWNPLFFPDSFVESLILNPDGSYELRQVGGAIFPAFRRADHSGTAIGEHGLSFGYTAVRLP
jgi:hypothetical protein